jgi:hypothetical protein
LKFQLKKLFLTRKTEVLKKKNSAQKKPIDITQNIFIFLYRLAKKWKGNGEKPTVGERSLLQA